MAHETDALQVTGYVDRWSVRPGESLRIHVSCTEPEYEATLVRLVHGDLDLRGPGLREECIEHVLNGRRAGRVQPFAAGSCVLADALPAENACTLQTWVYPTRLACGREQGLLSWRGDTGSVSLQLDADGRLQARIRDRSVEYLVHDDTPLVEHAWHFVALTVDAGSVRLFRNAERGKSHVPALEVFELADGTARELHLTHALFGALDLEPCGHAQRPVAPFNGKLEAPRLFDRALTPQEIRVLHADSAAATDIAAQALASWDFVADAHSTRVPDTSGHGRHAATINRPLRLVPGRAFSGRTITPREAPGEFNAVHLHEDDLADAGWHADFELQVPADLRSGIYAMRLRAGATIDHVPFCVRAPRGQPGAALAVLVPTVSYMVYANIGMDPAILPPALRPLSNLAHAGTPRARYSRRHRLLSCYDLHADGSGVAIVSMLRPQLHSARPCDRSTFNDSPHQLGADLHLVDWLEAQGIAYDVVTDHDLHTEGLSALRPYRAVATGTHAEYWTWPMRQALDAYTSTGGRVAYLSGNGLYWVTALSDDGTLAEVRRPHGTRAWTAEPGAAYLSLSGELGGLWMHRGLAPQQSVGVGFSAQGFGPGCPYRRTEASRDPRYAFIFEGVEGDLIGDTPALVSGYGAAGYEVDRADRTLGTPADAGVLATSTGFSDCYQYAVENMVATMPGLGGSTCPEVRADLVYFDTPNDGAVFSTGSIAWCSALSWNNYVNAVSTVMQNVIRAFIAPGPLPGAKDRFRNRLPHD